MELFNAKVHVYQIPPLTSNRGHRADGWDVDAPLWTGRIKALESLGNANSTLDLRLEDAEDGQLFANGPYEGSYCVEPVRDSSRFFVLRVVDGSKRAFLGIGFEERGDAFDLMALLQDFDRRRPTAKPTTITAAIAPPQATDYSLKPGETITLNMDVRNTITPPSSESAAQPLGEEFGEFKEA